MKNLLSTSVNTARTLGAAALLSTNVARSDEALLPQGITLGQFPPSSIPALKNTFATQIISDVTPDPALVPSNSFRWLLVKTDTGLALTLPENHTGQIHHFGQGEQKFFVRFDTNTGLPEVSIDCTTWQPYTAGTPVNISREERATIQDISQNLQTLHQLQTQQATLSTTLTEQQVELTQIQTELTALQTDLALTDYTLTLTESDLSQKESTRNTLETTMKPEAKLRTDTHPIAENTSIDDTTKTTLTQSALNTYDMSGTIAQMPAPSPSPAPTSDFIPPTLSDVQSTLTVLTGELTRIQDQITTLNTQITAKQNEITATENEISSLQNLINGLEDDKVYWQNEYNYWKGEYNRLDGLLTTASWNLGAATSAYLTDKGKLENVGRTDIPAGVDTPNMVTLLSNLKTKIQAEADAVPSTPKTGTTGTDVGLPDEPSEPRSYLEGQYKYMVDFPSSGVSWPAILRTYIQLPTKTSFSNGTTYTVYNRNHSINTFNNTAKLRIEKLIQKGFVDNVLETDYENYKTQNGIISTNTPKLQTAETNRDDAETELFVTNLLLLGKEDLLVAEQENRAVLAQQKSQLDSLKSTKSQLQTLYNRVKTIINQLKQHIASHSTITQAIADLLVEAQTLEDEITALELLITAAEGDEAALKGMVASTSENLTITNNTLNQTEQDLLQILQDIPILRPADPITRTSTNALVPATEALKYFADGFRTGYNTKTLSGLPAKWIIRYAYDGINAESTNIYPASISVQYVINGRAYTTDGQKVNNFAHKELTNSDLEKVITQLNACIALLNQYPAGSNQGIEKFLGALKTHIAQLSSPTSTNAVIRNHETATNTLTQKTLLQGGSYALFEHLLANNPTFSMKIEQITDLIAQKGTIPDGTDALNDLRHMMTTIFAQAFAERLMTTGTDGLDLYTHWEQESLSFVNGLGDTSTFTNQLDMNADWTIDTHGNKYKFGLYHPAGLGVYTPPATLFMMYSPDGTNTQAIGPVQVSSGAEADAMKARWKQELLKMKRSHTTYNGGAYDIFRGTDETGGYVYWGKYIKRSGGWIEGGNFIGSYDETTKYVKGKIDTYNQFLVEQRERAQKELFLSRFLFLMLRREQDMVLDVTYRNLLQTRLNQLELDGYSSTKFRFGDQDMGITEGELLILGEIYGGALRAQQGLSDINAFLSLYPDNGEIIRAIIFEEQSHLTPFEDEIVALLRRNGSFGLGQIQSKPSQADKDFFGFQDSNIQDLMDTQRHLEIMNERINKIRKKLEEYNIPETPENIGKAWNGGPTTITGTGSQHAQDYGKRISIYYGNTDQIIHDIKTNSIPKTLAGYMVYLDEIHFLLNIN